MPAGDQNLKCPRGIPGDVDAPIVGKETCPEARPRKLLPDMDAIDETVQVYQRLGRELLASLDKIQKAGLTITISPGGPIVVRIPPMKES